MEMRSVTYSAKTGLTAPRSLGTPMAPRMFIIFFSAWLAFCIGLSDRLSDARMAPTSTTITMAKRKVYPLEFLLNAMVSRIQGQATAAEAARRFSRRRMLASMT